VSSSTGKPKGDLNLAARTDGGRLVHSEGTPALIGSFAYAHITDSSSWALFGELV
jgi:tRNA-2-methylthio-N6-dimethylallyladenosine synthase